MAKQDKHSAPPRKKPERDHIDELLDEALKGTFPASDPVAISFGEQADPKTRGGRG